MKKYKVGIHERVINWSLVEAPNKPQALQEALDGMGEEIEMEYVETLDAEHYVKEIESRKE
jgi:hypothetical protein